MNIVGNTAAGSRSSRFKLILISEFL